jgi:hypothetical protein
MRREQLKTNVILRGPLFPEPVHEPILSAEQLDRLDPSPEKEPCDGDPHGFRLGIEAVRLGLAYEHDSSCSLSRSPASIRCPANLKPFTTTSSSCRASVSCSRTTLVRARPAWQVCS